MGIITLVSAHLPVVRPPVHSGYISVNYQIQSLQECAKYFLLLLHRKEGKSAFPL